jgi:hypothetical protein
MADCNACTPQHMNPVGTNCRGVPIRFTVQGRGTPFVNIGPVARHFHVPYLKYGAIPGGYRVDYEPVRWSCTCPDFVLNLRRQSCCKHIMMCIDFQLPGHSGTEYPGGAENYLRAHVLPELVPSEAMFRQLVPDGL